jgi:hypothetical protein
MLENPARCYDPGYAAGATLRRACYDVRPALQTETMCEQGLRLRLESWAAHHFARMSDAGAPYRECARDHFRRGFRDGYWNRARRRDGDKSALELVA